MPSGIAFLFYNNVCMPFLKRWTVILSSIGSIASIIGLIIFCFSDQTGLIVSLSFFCICLLLILIATISVLFSFIKNENNVPYKKVSVFTRYETSDGIHIAYETYRVIQSKRIILTEVKQGFKWSGSKMPVITSRLQEVANVISHNDNTYDQAILKLKKPLLFNETGTVHFHAEMDDFDGCASPYLDFKVDMPVNIIHYRIILKHKPANYCIPAKLLKRKIDTAIPAEYIPISSVEFDKESKSYEYHLIAPEVGYFYRLEWKK